jgi:hypothetical protein
LAHANFDKRERGALIKINFQPNGCAFNNCDVPGAIAGGNRVLRGALQLTVIPTLAHNASMSVGKFVYRML